ncbi:MAG: hypothetical protein H7338_22225 [Candidatus Sericytochromatia bacterium]|nr:hypothetical protein [Candidatus Sericytochromatia bacterium]
MDADVVGLMDVASLLTLRNFRDKYLADMGYRNLVLIKGNDTRGIDVGLMSPFPVTGIKSHKGVTFPVPDQPAPQKLGRDLLQASIKLPGGDDFSFCLRGCKRHISGIFSFGWRVA